MNRLTGAVGVGSVTVVVGLLAASAILMGAKSPLTADDLAVQAAAREAATDILLPYAFDAIDFANGRLATVGKAAAMKSDIAGRLDAVFTAEIGTSWKAAINDAIDRQASGAANIDLQGGIESVEFTNTTVEGDSAKVTGAVKVWQDYADPASLKVTHGTGWYDFVLSEVRTKDGWRVSSTGFSQHIEPLPSGSNIDP